MEETSIRDIDEKFWLYQVPSVGGDVKEREKKRLAGVQLLRKFSLPVCNRRDELTAAGPKPGEHATNVHIREDRVEREPRLY